MTDEAVAAAVESRAGFIKVTTYDYPNPFSRDVWVRPSAINAIEVREEGGEVCYTFLAGALWVKTRENPLDLIDPPTERALTGVLYHHPQHTWRPDVDA